MFDKVLKALEKKTSSRPVKIIYEESASEVNLKINGTTKELLKAISIIIDRFQAVSSLPTPVVLEMISKRLPEIKALLEKSEIKEEENG